MANEFPKKPGSVRKPAVPKPSSPGPVIEIGIIAAVLLFAAWQFYNSSSSNSFLDIPAVATFTFVWKILSAVVSLASLSGIVYVVIKNAVFHPLHAVTFVKPFAVVPQAPARSPERLLESEWSELLEKLDSASDADAAILIIEADALVDKALKAKGLAGESMGERMKALTDTGEFKNADNLWEAHKIRNQIAHEGPAGVHYSDAVVVITKFEKALKELEVI